MIEKWKKALDIGSVGGALLSDLSKAFDCIKHNLMIATNIHKIFEANSSFFVKKRIAGKVQFLFFSRCQKYCQNFNFGRGITHKATILRSFEIFLIFHSPLRS